MHGGKLKRPVTKPRLTTDQIKQRLVFCNKWLGLLEGMQDVYYCFLDEKWFYMSSRRKKMKILPQADFESPEDAFIPKPKLRSRRYPCKVMFMGLICPPIKLKENGIETKKYLADGKILLKRVSEQVLQKRASYHQNFVPKFEINHMLRNKHWKHLYPKDGTDLTAARFLSLIADEYDLADDIASDLVLTYDTFSQSRKTKVFKKKMMKLTLDNHNPVLGNKKIKYKITDEILGERKLKLSDMVLKVNPKKGKLVEKDITCDSQFMMSHIRDIGRAIRSTYSFLPATHPIFLFMDNAGGHGTELAKMEYVDILQTHYNVEICWQVSNSPETNILDLGIWCLLQSLVEYLHRNRRMKEDCLARTIEQAWDLVDGFTKFKSVSERWKKVLSLILLDKGGNSLVEKCRGLRKSLDDITVLLAEQEEVLDDVDDYNFDSDGDKEEREVQQ